MTPWRKQAWLVVAALIGALVGLATGALLLTGTERYEATATVAIIPAAGLPEDLSADFWQVLSEQQVVRTAATIYGNDQWADSAADNLQVPRSEVTLTASALVDTTLVRVSVESGSAGVSDAILAEVLDSAGEAATEILRPFVISRASVELAEPARQGTTVQLVGAATVAGALVGAGIGVLVNETRSRHRRTGGAAHGGGIDDDSHTGGDRDGRAAGRHAAPTAPDPG